MEKLKRNGIVILTVLSLSVTSLGMHNLKVNAKETGAEMLEAKCESVKQDVEIKEDKKCVQNRADSKGKVNKIMKKIQKKKSYDKNYSGTYLNDEQELVVLTCGDDKELKKIIDEECGKDEVEIKKVKYSYNALKDEYDLISDCIGDIDFANATYLDEVNNSIVVCIDKMDSSKMDYIRSLSKNPNMIDFKVSSEVDISAGKTIHPGQRIVVGKYEYSMGFRAYYDSSKGKVKGFLTAGHSNKVGDKAYVYTSNGNMVQVGTVKYRKFSGKIDASFVALTGDNTASRKVFYDDNKNTDTASGVNLCKDCLLIPQVGDTVYKAGATTYLTKGKILSVNFTANYDSVVIKNMILTSCAAGKGDSGGVLYEKYAGTYEQLGVQSGVVTSTKEKGKNKYKESIFTSADLITNLDWGKNGVWIY